MYKGNIDYRDTKIQFFLPLVKDKCVLDIGVVQHEREKYQHGTWLHRAIKESSKDCVGLDIDQDGVNFLKKDGYHVVNADAQSFDLGVKFDVVVAGDIIEHLSNVGGFLDSVKKHLSPNGILALSTPNQFWWKTYLLVAAKGNAKPHPQHTCWFCEKTLEQVLTRHGFEIVSISYGTVYNLATFNQRMTKRINTVLLLPNRFRHNTIMITAKIA